MRNPSIVLAGAFSLATVIATAQPPGERPRDNQGSATGDSMAARLFAYDKNNDGKLTKDELTDERLQPLFERADADRDGSVTKAELLALFEKEASTGRGGPGGGQGGGPGGPGDGRGPGGPGGNPPGGPGGQAGGPAGRGPGGPPQPGQIMPLFMQDELRLTDSQKKQLTDLQKEVDAKLETILTADQKQQLKEMRDRGPGGPGGQGGRPPGGPGGQPRPNQR